MTVRRRVAIAAATLVATVLYSRPAAADAIVWGSTLNAAPFGATSATPFDPTLGTLDRVDVQILGTLLVQGTALPNLLPIGPFGTPEPVPYSFEVQAFQDVFGLGGKYFDFTGNAEFRLSGFSTGGGEAFSLSTPFIYSFSFTATTDLIGFTLPSLTASGAVAAIPPLGGITGQRSDFLESVFPIDEIDMVQSAFGLPGAGPGPLVSSISTTSALLVTYTYTPAPIDTPEPGTLALLVTGVAAVIGRRRRLLG